MPDTNLLDKAGAALSDELYDLAEKNARAFLAQPNLTGEKQGEGVILLARALHGKFDYVRMRDLLAKHYSRLKSSRQVEAVKYWLALAEFELGHLDKCLDMLGELLFSSQPDSEYRPPALRLRARAFLMADRLNDALSSFAEFIQTGKDQQQKAAFRLEWGRALLDANAKSQALDALIELAKLHPDTHAAYESRIIIARIYIDENKPGQAYETLQSAGNAADIPDILQSIRLLTMADALDAQTNRIEALELIDQCLTRATDSQIINAATLRKGMLLLKMGKTDEGISLTRKYVSNAPTETAADVQLQLGITLHLLNMQEKALTELRNYIETFSEPKGLSSAWLLIGNILTELNRWLEAAAAYEKSATLTESADAAATAWQKASENLFTAGQYAAAEQAANKALRLIPDGSSAEQSLFQIAQCRKKQQLDREAMETLWALIDSGPDETMAARGFLKIADILQQLEQPENARDIYRLVLDHYPTAHPSALHMFGCLEYRQGNFEVALRLFTRVTNEHPESHPAPLSDYMRAWCLFMLGRDDDAVKNFKEFLTRHPKSKQAPEALFWLAEHDFNCGAYYMAEDAFLRLQAQHPESLLADDALFRAGRAALSQQEFRRANEHFARLIRLYPGAAKKAEARFYQGESLCELGEFANAILIFDEIIKQFPNTYLAELAWFRKGDSQFTLGAENPQRYIEAVESYRMILNRTDTTPPARIQAQYKIGRCLEKTGQLNEAFENYMNVVYDFFNHPRYRQQSAVWFTRAAFSAAAIKENEKAWRKAVSIYQRVADTDVAASTDARERIRKIRMDQWMFFY